MPIASLPPPRRGAVGVRRRRSLRDEKILVRRRVHRLRSGVDLRNRTSIGPRRSGYRPAERSPLRARDQGARTAGSPPALPGRAVMDATGAAFPCVSSDG